MKWKKNIDLVVTVVSLLLMLSGAILFYYRSDLQLLSAVIFLIGLVLLILEALGGGEKEEPKFAPAHPASGLHG